MGGALSIWMNGELV
ncbi:MAG: hypothetical protein COW39_15130, partial [Comamonadaceae bacterium CG17_big_fil_post_rev_8_21_14_2_50_60_13]